MHVQALLSNMCCQKSVVEPRGAPLLPYGTCMHVQALPSKYAAKSLLLSPVEHPCCHMASTHLITLILLH